MPSSFVPEEDEGYFIAIIQAPSGSSLEYTTNIAKQAEAIIVEAAGGRRRSSVAGFSFSGAAPNPGADVRAAEGDRRAPEGEDQSLARVLGRMRGPLLGGIPGALVIPVAPPAIQGLSTFGGFQFELLDQSGGDISNLRTSPAR